MALPTYSDVETALGRPGSLTRAQQDQVTWWLGGIELLIRNRFGAIEVLDSEAVRYVEAEAAAEKARRAGQSETSITVSVDDGTVTRRWESPVSASDITEEWWDLLAPKRASSAYSTRPAGRRDTDWAHPRTQVSY